MRAGKPVLHRIPIKSEALSPPRKWATKAGPPILLKSGSGMDGNISARVPMGIPPDMFIFRVWSSGIGGIRLGKGKFRRNQALRLGLQAIPYLKVYDKLPINP